MNALKGNDKPVDRMPPSIFNDVIGPVMRGPSSSHVVAAYRMGKIARASVIHSPARVSVSFDSKSSLAHTYHGHGSDFGFVGGFLNIDMADPRITDAVEIAKESGIEVVFRIEPLDSDHPSFYRIETADDRGHTQRWDAISTGGGMFEMVGFNGFPLRFDGGSNLVLVETADARGLDPRIRNHLSGVKKSSLASRRDRMELLVYELGNPPAADEWQKIRAIAGGDRAVLLPLALAGYAEVIGLDETIQAVRGIGMEMPASLRCTCGGLGATPTSLRLMKERDGLKG